jgi:hypothetical protein
MTSPINKPCLFLAAIALFALARSAAGANSLTDAERSAGWRLLFDGTSLSGWRGLKNANPGAGWKVIDGAIVRTAKSGDILTVEEFGDFELTIEWKIEGSANSGILYRVGLGESQTFFTGPEFQVLDNTRTKEPLDPKRSTGALYDLVAPPRDLTRPIGTWNETRIVVRGWHVEHWLNGEKIVDADLASPAGKALIAHSKFASMPHFAGLARGHIALQDEENSVSYRNIKIRETPGNN